MTSAPYAKIEGDIFYAGNPTGPACIGFHSFDRLVVTVNLESGTVTIADGVTIDEAAQAFWDAVQSMFVAPAVNSYDESRKLLREAVEKLDALTLMLRSMKEARNGTALDMDGDELFGFVLPHESYMNAHMILNDVAWFARIRAHLEAGQ